jgi:hypothetical protein
MEQDKYINEIIKLTKSINLLTLDSFNANPTNNLLNVASSLCLQNDYLNSSSNIRNISNEPQQIGTPLTNRRSLFSSKIERAVHNIKQNYNLNTNGI